MNRTNRHQDFSLSLLAVIQHTVNTNAELHGVSLRQRNLWCAPSVPLLIHTGRKYAALSSTVSAQSCGHECNIYRRCAANNKHTELLFSYFSSSPHWFWRIKHHWISHHSRVCLYRYIFIDFRQMSSQQWCPRTDLLTWRTGAVWPRCCGASCTSWWGLNRCPSSHLRRHTHTTICQSDPKTVATAMEMLHTDTESKEALINKKCNWDLDGNSVQLPATEDWRSEEAQSFTEKRKICLKVL